MPRTTSACPRVVVVVIALLTLLVPAAPPAGAQPIEGDPVPAATYAFGPSGLDGAGFQNVGAFSPFRDVDGNRPLLLGADIAGVHRSFDGGRSWLPSNAGLRTRKVAALLFSASIPGKVYAATDTGIVVSTDFGVHWSVRPAPVDFDANGAFQLGLAVDADGHVYPPPSAEGSRWLHRRPERPAAGAAGRHRTADGTDGPHPARGHRAVGHRGLGGGHGRRRSRRLRGAAER